MLAGALQELRNSSPGNIQEPTLPELRNFVVVDNQGEFKQQFEKLNIKSLIDWREIFVWQEDVAERHLLAKYATSLNKDEVINLQFTR